MAVAAAELLKDARRWKKELQLGKKRDEPWQKDAERIVKRYRGEELKKNRFNVLWANTEILRPAIYNSRPNPDVRRRFRDADPLGKAVAEVLERSLFVFVDGDETDDALKNDVLDGLLCGRGVSRVRYVPTISANVAPQQSKHDSGADDDETDGDPKPIDETVPDATDATDEEVESETVCLEHVDWRDFRHGYGRVWPEVPWVAYRHKLTRNEADEKFGEDAIESVEFSAPESDDPTKPEEVGETQKVAEFWEIWDKAGQRVFFTQEALDVLLFPTANPDGEPPLDFDGFFPSPRPLTIVENTGSLQPIPLFRLYEQQADELDRISGRIDKIIAAMRLRGVYDAKLSELAELLSKDDNELTPVANAQAWLDGGLDKAISWMPVEKAATLLASLYDARARQKAIIDELLGISDIIRGATDPNETATAQTLKSNYGSVRLQRMQKEVQRYARDHFRLAAAAMSQKFAPQTFIERTELNFPSAQAKMLAQLQYQASLQPPPPMAMPGPGPVGPPGSPQVPPAGAAPASPPQPPGPPPVILQMPTWEDVIGVMRSEKRQQYRIDVETDSTIAGTLSSDMAGLSQVLQAISQTLTGLAPLVQDGALPVDAAKEVVMAVIRRARMGQAVEDAFDKMTAPKPKPPPPDPSLAVAQVKAQSDAHLVEMKTQAETKQFQVEEQARQQLAAAKDQLEVQREAAEAQQQAQLDAADKAHREALEQMKIQAETERAATQLETQRMIADANNQTKVIVAKIMADNKQAMQVQQQAHEQQMATLVTPAGGTDQAPTAASYDAPESG